MRNLLVFLSLFAAACSSASTATNTQRSSRLSAPIPAPVEPVVSPINVSFSTYSEDWPVGWQWIDPGENDVPARYDVKKGVLRVSIPTGRDLLRENTSAPRYVKAVSGDFEIETRVAFSPSENQQGAGLLIYLNDGNFIRFERAYSVEGGGSGLRIDILQDEIRRTPVVPRDIRMEHPQVDLRLVRTNGHFRAFWRPDEHSQWQKAAEFDAVFPETVMAGLVMTNTAREATVEFAYIRLNPVSK